ncbi:oligopeptide ABC transporter permease OppB [Gallaecimonas mangrovi]|uniref:oligopeptide ABC transporter permease OppB n=1 Tax=Gallaecimonas mangrovi TaxID=2291597 RepID=UPI000E20A55E|nr:oligopeptide ABC transporter permease OppB [Gallaecimonas mangrovi]
MMRFILRRVLGAIPTLWVIITLSFFMLRAAPGGPFTTQRALPPQVMANLKHMYHLDEPLWEQYLRYLGNILHGNFGPSFVYRGTSVNDLIAQGFPVDIIVGGLALLLAMLIGIPLGIKAALKQNTAWDYVPMGVAMAGISIPAFVVAPLLVLVLAVKAKWLPAGGWSGGHPLYLVLPVVSLALPMVAYMARLMRGSMVEVLNSPFIRTARAKGMPERIVIYRHALKPAMMPLISFLGPATVATLTGSIVVEQIFGLPGIGRFFVNGAMNRDYTLVMGVTILYGMLIVLFNLLADVLYGLLDPRVRLS